MRHTLLPTDVDGVNYDHFESIRRALEALSKGAKAASVAKATLTAIKAGDLLQVAKGLSELASAKKGLALGLALLEESEFELHANAIADLAGDLRLSYPSILRQGLERDGYSVSGEWPSLVINHVFRLNIDLKKVEGTLNADRLTDLSPQTILGKVRQFDDALKSAEVRQRSFDAITRAYENAVSDLGTKSGDYVDIKSVFERRASTLRGGNRSLLDFGLELFAALNYDDENGWRFECSPAQNSSGGYFVPDSSGGNYIGALRLVKGEVNA